MGVLAVFFFLAIIIVLPIAAVETALRFHTTMAWMIASITLGVYIVAIGMLISGIHKVLKSASRN